MSSVLKALKKLDEEKRGGVSSSAPTNQRWASGGQPERRRRPWLVVGGGLAVALLIVLVLLWSERKPGMVATAPPSAFSVPPQDGSSLLARPDVATAAAPVNVESVQPATVGLPHAPAPQPQGSRPVVQPAPPRLHPQQKPAPQPKVSQPVVQPSPHPPAVVDSPLVTTTPRVAPLTSVVPQASVEIPVKQTQVSRFDIPAPGQEWVAPPQLIVSEILPPAGGERMAIVNGLPVMVGTIVDGALVEEIHADRVVLSIGGRHVSVPLRKGR